MDRSRQPVKVSPLIKGARWSLLLVGVMYGKLRRARLTAYEKIESVRRHHRSVQRMKKEKEEKRLQFIEEMRQIAKNFGIVVPRDWDPPF